MVLVLVGQAFPPADAVGSTSVPPRGIFMAVTGWRDVLYLLPLLVAPTLHAVEGPADAGRELARRLGGGFRGPVSFTLRNLSDLTPAEVSELRRTLESEL